MKNVTLTAILIVICLECFPQNQYTFVFLNKKEHKDTLTTEERRKIMEGHLANINQLAKEKKLLVAGPFEGGGGIFILNTTSVEKATGWLSTDPGVKANRWDIEILPFTLRYGSICEVQETAEMVTYNFVRFTPRVTKFNVKTASAKMREHGAYIQKVIEGGNVLADGSFGDDAGGIMIVRGELDPDVVEKSPGVLSTLLNFEIKKLWIAKGSFCEE